MALLTTANFQGPGCTKFGTIQYLSVGERISHAEYVLFSNKNGVMPWIVNLVAVIKEARYPQICRTLADGFKAKYGDTRV